MCWQWETTEISKHENNKVNLSENYKWKKAYNANTKRMKAELL